MLLFFGRIFAFAAIFLQIAVFLQSLLPEKYQISPVCETIALVVQQSQKNTLDSVYLNHSHHLISEHEHIHHEHSSSLTTTDQQNSHNHHDAGHQCQYCVVYSHVLPLPDIDLKEILIRIKVRFVAFQQSVLHVYFELQRLYLLPQGRAPPISL